MRNVVVFFKTHGFLLLLLLVVSIPALLPLFHTGFFVSDDGEWMIIRSSAFYTALRDGQFPVRFLHNLNFGYGYPVVTFLYPGFLYAGVFLQAIKCNAIETIKIVLGLSLVGSTLFTYLWLEKVFKQKIPSLSGALIALYIPYHLYDVYVRGSVGEIFALLWVPFILWMIERRSILFTSLGIALLILSHNTIAFLFIPVLLLYMLLRKSWNKRIIAAIVFAGIGMTAFFLVPVMAELPLTRFAQTEVSNPLLYFASLQLIGFSTILIVILAHVVFFMKHKSLRKETNVVRLFLMISVFCLLLSSSIGTVLWNILPSSFIQFPFRLLSYLIITIPFLVAFSLVSIKGKTSWFVVSVLLITAFASAYPYLSPKEYFVKDPAYYLTNEATTTVKDEYMPTWVKEKPLNRSTEKVIFVKGEAALGKIEYNNKSIRFSMSSSGPVIARVNTIYWPGWEAAIDGKPVAISHANKQGVMDIAIPPGKNTVTLIFRETPIRLASDVLSIVSLVLLLIFVKFYKVKR